MIGLYIKRDNSPFGFTRIGHATFVKPVTIKDSESARVTYSVGFNKDGSPYILDATCVAVKDEEVDDDMEGV